MSSSSSRPGRAQVHVRVDEGREGVQALGVDHLGAVGRLERPGRADLGDLAAADQQVVVAVDAGARVDHLGAADQRVRRLAPARGRAAAGACVASGTRVHAAPPIGAGARRFRRAVRLTGSSDAREHLEEHRHPDDDARLDLLGDQRLRRVDRLGAAARRRG